MTQGSLPNRPLELAPSVSEYLARAETSIEYSEGMGATVFKVIGSGDSFAGAPRGSVPLAVKAYYADGAERRMREGQALRALAACGATPRLVTELAADRNFPAGGLVMEWCPGTPARNASDLALSVQALAKIHHSSRTSASDEAGPPAVAPQDTLIADIMGNAGLMPDAALLSSLEETVSAWQQAFERVCPLPTLRCRVHTDLIRDNVLIDGSAAWIIDWDFSRISHPLWDLAHLLAPTTAAWSDAPNSPLTDREVQSVLDAYRRAYDVFAEEDLSAAVAALVPLVSIRCILWAVSLQGTPLAGPKDRSRFKRRLARYRLDDIFNPAKVSLLRALGPLP